MRVTRPVTPAAAPDLGRSLATKVTADRMFAHLRALQDIANANKGNRSDGTPGYDASVEYVAKALRDRVTSRCSMFTNRPLNAMLLQLVLAVVCISTR